MVEKRPYPQCLVSVVLNLAAMLEHADEALVPAVYAEMGQAFGVGPTALGTLTLVRAVSQALASPLCAYLATRYNRAWVIGTGCLVWGVATALVGVSTSYWEAALARAANGVGLAVTIPAVQSLVADLHPEGERGIAFGWMNAAGQMGTVAGGMFATVMGPRSVLGFGGWRFAFLVVAVISGLTGSAVYSIVDDPSHKQQDYDSLGMESCDNLQQPQATNSVRQVWKGTKKVVAIPTFQVIVAQGIVASTPGNAMAFLTLWMELLGFSHGRAALLVALLPLGTAAGSLFGGWVGDQAASYLPNAGRIMCSQLSAGMATPLAALLLLGLPKDSGGAAWLYALVLLSLGFVMSWNAPATNWPIFSEIVPGQLRTTVYALDMALEKSVAALGAPLVGVLAVHVYGFRKVEQKKGGESGAAVAKDLSNARALGHGLFFCIAVPVVLCLGIASFLYCTYPKDREQVKKPFTVEEQGKSSQERESLRDWDDAWNSLMDETGDDDGFLLHNFETLKSAPRRFAPVGVNYPQVLGRKSMPRL